MATATVCKADNHAFSATVRGCKAVVAAATCLKLRSLSAATFLKGAPIRGAGMDGFNETG